VPQKKSQENINSRLALVMKSGKFTLGTKTSIKCMRSGKGETARYMTAGRLLRPSGTTPAFMPQAQRQPLAAGSVSRATVAECS
jgi:hypothetical protein